MELAHIIPYFSVPRKGVFSTFYPLWEGAAGYGECKIEAVGFTQDGKFLFENEGNWRSPRQFSGG